MEIFNKNFNSNRKMIFSKPREHIRFWPMQLEKLAGHTKIVFSRKEKKHTWNGPGRLGNFIGPARVFRADFSIDDFQGKMVRYDAISGWNEEYWCFWLSWMKFERFWRSLAKKKIDEIFSKSASGPANFPSARPGPPGRSGPGRNFPSMGFSALWTSMNSRKAS